VLEHLLQFNVAIPVGLLVQALHAVQDSHTAADIALKLSNGNVNKSGQGICQS
jgi:hypothetical protein